MDQRKLEQAIEKVGGRFRLSVLMQRRARELTKGAPKLIDGSELDLLDTVLEEILQGKIQLAGNEELEQLGGE